MSDGNHEKHSAWMGMGKMVGSFVVGVVAASFVVGSRIQKVNDVVTWKAEVAPKLERMDMQGTQSFTHFHQQYEKEQAQQYERIKELEKESRQIEVIKQKIEGLERAQRYPPEKP